LSISIPCSVFALGDVHYRMSIWSYSCIPSELFTSAYHCILRMIVWTLWELQRWSSWQFYVPKWFTVTYCEWFWKQLVACKNTRKTPITCPDDIRPIAEAKCCTPLFGLCCRSWGFFWRLHIWLLCYFVSTMWWWGCQYSQLKNSFLLL